MQKRLYIQFTFRNSVSRVVLKIPILHIFAHMLNTAIIIWVIVLGEMHGFLKFTEKEERLEVYRKLSRNLNKEARLFAHFLIPYNEVANIFVDNERVEQRLEETFKCWDVMTEDNLRTWTRIMQILVILKKKGYIKDIDKGK